MIDKKYIVPLFALILIGSVSAEGEKANPSLIFEPFQEPMEGTNDNLTYSLTDNAVTLDTGETGYCGVAGVRVPGGITFSDDASHIKFESKAVADGEASTILGFALDGELDFNYETDSSGVTYWAWENHTVDVSDYAGRNVNMSFVVGDRQDDCNDKDHSQSLNVRNIRLFYEDDTQTSTEDTTENIREVSKDRFTVRQDETVRALIGGEESEIKIESVTGSGSAAAVIDGEQTSIYEEETVRINGVTVIPIEVASKEFEEEEYSESGVIFMKNLPEGGEFSIEFSNDEVSFGETFKSSFLVDGELIAPQYLRGTVYSPEGSERGNIEGNPIEGPVERQNFDTGRFTIVARAITSDGVLKERESFVVKEQEKDLNDADEVFEDAVLVMPSDASTELESDAVSLSGVLGLETINDDSDRVLDVKQSRDLILYGSPETNELMNELSRNSEDVWSSDEYSSEDARLHLVEDAYTKGNDVLIVSGGAPKSNWKAAERVNNLFSGRDYDELEGEKELKLQSSVQEKETTDLQVEDLQVVDNKENYLTMGLSIENPGSQRRVSPKITPEPEARPDQYELESGQNFIGWRFEADSLYKGRRTVELSTGNPKEVVVRGTSYELDAGMHRSPDGDEAIEIIIDGRKELVKEEGGFSMGSRTAEVTEVKYTGARTGEAKLLLPAEKKDELEVSLELGDITRSKTVDLQERTEAKMISLSKGWNMISLGQSEFDEEGQMNRVKVLKIDNLEDDCQLETYKGENSWMYRNGGWTHPDAVGHTQGVYVKAAEDCNALVEHSLMNSDSTRADRTLGKGWNMISVGEGKRFSEINSNCAFEEYQGSKIWHYSNGEWTSFNEGELDPKKGYYVKVAEDCETGVQDAPPSPTANFFLETGGGVFQ